MGEFSSPLFLSPLLSFFFFLIPQILISSITLLQKFTTHFKILDPRLATTVARGFASEHDKTSHDWIRFPRDVRDYGMPFNLNAQGTSHYNLQ